MAAPPRVAFSCRLWPWRIPDLVWHATRFPIESHPPNVRFVTKPAKFGLGNPFLLWQKDLQEGALGGAGGWLSRRSSKARPAVCLHKSDLLFGWFRSTV